MLRSLALATLAWLFWSVPTGGSAAEITVWDQEIQGRAVIQIDGLIVSGDDDKLRSISREHSTAFVVLRSNGGQLRPALDMGRLIRLAGYETVVLGRDECASACALIWAAGSTRWLSTEGRVGFHASYRNENGQPVESGVANALIGHYLSALGYPAKSVVFATSATPTEILWLTRSNSPQSGYSFEDLPSVWGNVALQRGATPPPIFVSPRPAKQSELKPHVALDWTWGWSGSSKIMEFKNVGTNDWYYHVKVPAFAERDTILLMLYEYTQNRWIWIGDSVTGTVLSFDPDSIELEGLLVLVWLQTDHSNNSTTPYRSSKEYQLFGCTTKTYLVVEAIDEMPDGTVSSYRAPSYQRPSNIAPDTVAEKIWRTICWR